jgi:DNA-binding MarR family transcriptional regulator
MSKVDEQTLGDLLPSAKLVLVVLDHEEPLTQKQIVEETWLSARTVRSALGRLKELNAISEQINFMDARQTLYTATHSTSSPETA